MLLQGKQLTTPLPADLRSKVSEAQLAVASANLQMEGVRKFFDAALMVKDYKGAEKYRAQLHALIDVVLDNTSVIYSIIQHNAKL